MQNCENGVKKTLCKILLLIKKNRAQNMHFLLTVQTEVLLKVEIVSRDLLTIFSLMA